eukprot:TRINITY_DN2144_c0_g1_i2.p1 TRINITY_DN2144_c0_g1~~TRINITY_DN2144_c0_g1_i2.p1  ORF type:complete len:322 (+),score=92.24 TRINITY_DN2144_c0_g1_i2:1517-2482(+)
MIGLLLTVQACSITSVAIIKHLLDKNGSGVCFTLAGVQLLLKWVMLEAYGMMYGREHFQAQRQKQEQMHKRLLATSGRLGFLAVSLSYAASYVVGLFSLEANSLLFDQLFKVGTVPATLLLQSAIRFNDPAPPFAWLALASTTCGCLQFFRADRHASAHGLATLVAGFAVRSVYDVWAHHRDHDLYTVRVTVMSVLGPPAAAQLLAVAVLYDADMQWIVQDATTVALVVVSTAANLCAHMGMTVIIEETAPHVPFFLCVFKLLLFEALSHSDAVQAMGTLLVMVGLMAILEPHLAHWLLLIGTTYITFFSNDVFVSPFHFA